MKRKPSFFARHLDPSDQLGETLFGIIMTLSFTLSAGVLLDESSAITMAVAIVGCNLAWGFIDGVMCVIGNLFERSRKVRLLQSICAAQSDDEALVKVADALDDRIKPLVPDEERQVLYRNIFERLKEAELPRTGIEREDFLGAIVTFAYVFWPTFPGVIPLFIVPDPWIALRISNGLSLLLLLYVGVRCARATNSNPWVVAPLLLLAGLAMVGIAIALGG